MTIRQNLAEAIRGIRKDNTIVPVWIDALSINQKDPTERAQQVPRMGEIYDFAVSVFSYIGKATEETESVFWFMRDLFNRPRVREKDNEFYFPSVEFPPSTSQDGQNTIEPKKLAQLCAGLYKLLTRQYFRRVWILQVRLRSWNLVVAFGLTASTGGSVCIQPRNIVRARSKNPIRLG